MANKQTNTHTHNLGVIQDKLVGGDCGGDALAGVLQPSHWLHCILALRPPRTLVLHRTPATQWVVVTDAALTISEVSTLLQRNLENLVRTVIVSTLAESILYHVHLYVLLQIVCTIATGSVIHARSIYTARGLLTLHHVLVTGSSTHNVQLQEVVTYL